MSPPLVEIIHNVIITTELEEAKLRVSNHHSLFGSVLKLGWDNPHIKFKRIFSGSERLPSQAMTKRMIQFKFLKMTILDKITI